MERLSDFKPLARVELPELGDLDCSGLVLVVGPNSSGKTQLLRDLYRRLRGDKGELVVARDIALKKITALEPFLACLEQEGYIEQFKDDGNNQQIRSKTTFVGTGESSPALLSFENVQTWYRSYSDPNASLSNEQAWLSQIGRYLVTALFLERRLIAANQTGLIDFETQPPQQDLHALYMNDDAQRQLLNEMRNTFGRTVWPDISKGNALSVRVSGRRDAPTSEDRLSPAKMMAYRTIESEGDGLKSYVATCIALLLGRRPVCLVDEPEMCLHPPQAYNLGRFIGRFGSSPDLVTFVATHSSDLLRGVIDVGPPKLQIVRLVRRGEKFAAHLVESSTLREALHKPAVRAESVLDGIFSQAVVVLESDTDRTVYQPVFEKLHEEFQIDIHFATVGGSGGIGDTCRLYRTLKIPVAVIADLDVLIDSSKLRQILESLSENQSMVKGLMIMANEVGTKIRQIVPNLSPSDLKDRLNVIVGTEISWSKEDDVGISKKLRGIANDLDRGRRLKRGGIASFPADLHGTARQLLKELSEHGLFLVPVGELEQWLNSDVVSASKEKKPEWANEAASYIRSVEPGNDGVWHFIRTIGHFLCK